MSGSGDGKRSKNMPKGGKGGTFTSTMNADDMQMFPERSPFFADILALRRDDELIAAFERDVLYEQERNSVMAMVPPPAEDYVVTSPLTGGFESPNEDAEPCTRSACQDFFSVQWEKDFAKYEELYEREKKLGQQEFPQTATPEAQIISKKVAQSFKRVFVNSDIVVRDAEQGVTSAVICESIMKDIVAQASELYAARCFDSISEGYAAYSMWKEVRSSVARSFLPQDYAQLDLRNSTKPKGNNNNTTMDGFTSSMGTSYSGFGLLSPSTPFAFMMSAEERMSLASKGAAARVVPAGPSTVDAANAGPGAPPPSVPIDDYSRYVISSEKKPRPVSSSRVASDNGRNRKASPRAGSAGTPQRLSKQASVVQNETGRTSPTIPSASLTPRRNRALRKKSTSRRSTIASAVDDMQSVVKADELTTAIRLVPASYFHTNASSSRQQHASEEQEKTSPSSPRPDEDMPTSRRPKKGGATNAKSQVVASGVVGVERDKLIPQLNVTTARQRNFEHRKRMSVRRESLSSPSFCADRAAVSYRVVNCEEPSADEQTPAEVVVAQASPTRKRSGAMFHKEKPKQSERKRRKELEEQRIYEKRFVSIVELTEEEKAMQEHQIELTPQPGVVLQQPPAAAPMSARRKHIRNPRKDEPIILADGGAFITPSGKQRLNDYKAKAEARGVSGTPSKSAAKQQAGSSEYPPIAAAERRAPPPGGDRAKALNSSNTSSQAARLPRLPLVSN